ncbi:MAG TPA: D-ribose pyranase [bacterium]|nr:D-ribose pyranase [bacterium]
MKRRGILNPDLAYLVASLGHTDLLCIADAGLPIPPGVTRIDLALRCGLPPFLETVRAILGEVVVQRAIVAGEMAGRNRAGFEGLRALLEGIPLDRIPHEQLKAALPRVRAVIRTGECTPYANVLLECGVAF